MVERLSPNSFVGRFQPVYKLLSRDLASSTHLTLHITAMELSRLANHDYSRIAFTCCYDVRYPLENPAETERTNLTNVTGYTTELHARHIAVEKDPLRRWLLVLAFTQR